MKNLKEIIAEADAKSAKAVARMTRARKRHRVLQFHNAKLDFRAAIAVLTVATELSQMI